MLPAIYTSTAACYNCSNAQEYWQEIEHGVGAGAAQRQPRRQRELGNLAGRRPSATPASGRNLFAW